MGVVYEARHRTLGTRHAVKLLQVPDPVLRARLLREGRLQARLVHRNIVPVEEILEMVRDRLAASPFRAEPRGRVVLTGGASQLTGLPDLAAQVLGRQVRVGRPLGISGLPEEAKGPAFAVATGLLVYPQAAHLEHFEPRRTRHSAAGGGYIARVGQWLRESF